MYSSSSATSSTYPSSDTGEGARSLARYVGMMTYDLWYKDNYIQASAEYLAWIYSICIDIQLDAELGAMVIILMFKSRSQLAKLTLTQDGHYRAFIASLLLAHKYCRDMQYELQDWVDLTGYSLDELRSMEIEYLRLIRYQFFITPSERNTWTAMRTQSVRVLSRGRSNIEPH